VCPVLQFVQVLSVLHPAGGSYLSSWISSQNNGAFISNSPGRSNPVTQ